MTAGTASKINRIFMVARWWIMDSPPALHFLTSNVRAEREGLYVSTLRRSKIMPYLMFQCVSCVSERIEDTIQPREPFDYSTDAHEVRHYLHLFFGQMALLH